MHAAADKDMAMELPVVVDCAREPAPDCRLGLIVGIDEDGVLPDIDAARFDVLLTAHPDPPAPWMALGNRLERMERNVGRSPIAAARLVDLMRMQQGLPFAEALERESIAYSDLLGGTEFARWLAENPDRWAEPIPDAPVTFDFDEDAITLTLADPGNRNAISAPMRDALYDALLNVRDYPGAPPFVIEGAGRCFSTGGLLAEFGTATDLARAHEIRMARANALLLHRMRERATVRFHGATIGSGLEIFAAAGTRIGEKGAWFQLPESRMGLIPGAGGTVTLSHAIGRHRACCLMLTGERFGAREALRWGLIDRIEG